MILSLCAIVLTMILVIGLHELGHAGAARLLGVKIHRIAIGFGKPLLKWRDRAGREWVWALWPLGGAVHLLNTRIEPVAEQDFPFCFDKKPIWVRCFILLAGALANLLTAWLALSLMFMLGYKQLPPLIESVKPQSIAAQAGLQAGDCFKELAGQKTASWQELGMALIINLGKEQVPVVVHDQVGQQRQLSLDLNKWHYNKKDSSLLAALGIEPWRLGSHSKQVAGKTFLTASAEAMHKIGSLLHFFIMMIKQLMTGILPFAILLGPLGLFTVSIHSFLQGFSVFLYFIASFSLAVGLVNLFPIPGLDGGSIVYALVEKLRAKPVSVAMEVLLHRLVLIIFSVLFIQLILNDLQRYIR